MRFDNWRIAIAGMGVTGLAVGKAVQHLGGRAVVFDQKPNDNPSVMSAVDALDAQGIEAVTGWHGRLDPADFELLVVSPGFPRQHPAIRDMLGGQKPVWGEPEFAYRISDAPILAITGTNGKSTTTVMLWNLLNGSGKKAHLCGNIAGSGYPERTLTEAALGAGHGDVLVAEVSSYHMEWVDEFRPTVAAITNITPDHMDRYRDFEEYAETKKRLFDRMGSGDSIVLNLDDLYLSPKVLEAAQGRTDVVGFSPGGAVSGTGATRRTGGVLNLSGMDVAIDDLPLYGEHNVANAMMAWEMASRVCEVGPGTLEALRSFKGLANRMERLGERDGVLVVNNSMCTNPAAVIASSKSLPRKQHILMGGITKQLDFTPVGEYLRGTGHRVYVYGPEPDRMIAMLGDDWPVYGTLEQAFESAAQNASRGEVVILAPGCASAEPYANFKERGDDFRRMAQEWLAASV